MLEFFSYHPLNGLVDDVKLRLNQAKSIFAAPTFNSSSQEQL